LPLTPQSIGGKKVMKTMASKRTLTIKDWHGTGKGDLKLEILDFEIQRLNYGQSVLDRITIRRKPDQYSSRIGMMAYLNKNRRRLSWGFAGMRINVKEFSGNGVVIARREYSFSGGAVETSAAESGLEIITLLTNQIGSLCMGKC